ncbi:sulfatase-like hydrolase/transferase [Runella salmonicolor]|uniref:Sulfatase-like hydrolase/transferase n=1 Tax=Runella salmonicolor TaxID=2950278 RepID=A0ABT1FIT6_9BACT|nr:sulfatase-like hydrolase/transferase [Runella salmonicolor]MCP1381654.1 sulfatase-like hydrolase/transferase [Runella salmonicolor]
MQKIVFLFSTAFVLTMAAFVSKKRAQSVASQVQKPNVIVIVADDLGYNDVGFNGCQDIPTPHIDRIAKAGVVFSSGHVSFGVCSPSRAGLLTGRYQYRFGYERNPLYVTGDSTMGLPLTEETMADVLGRSGYNSMLVGKWHLGAHKSLHPLKRGFNEFFGFLGGGHQYFPENLTLQNPEDANGEGESYRTKLNRNYTVVEETEYLTDALSREAVSFVERNKQKPFFLYLAYNAPHAPLQATEKYLKRFENIKNTKRRTYAAMVSAVDDGVGRLLDKLKEIGQIDNTIIVFLSDNGGPIADNGSSNAPLRGQKGSVFEGGIRVPFVMQWTGKIPAKLTYDKPIIALDILSTVLANIKGAAKPKNPLDGTDLLPYLTNKTNKAPHDFLFWRMYDRGNYAIIQKDEKKMVVLKDSVYLYDLKKEINEATNSIDKEKKLADEMGKARVRWEKGMIAPVFLGLTQREEYEKLKGMTLKK